MARRRSSAPASNPPISTPADEPVLSARAVNTLLTIILVVFLVLGGMYLSLTPAATPDQHNPDENAHMLSVASVATGHLPVFQPGAADYEAHQPPLYYLLCAPVYAAARAQGPAAAVRAVRSASLFLGALLVWAAFGCVRALFPARPLLALGTAAFVALLPMNLALSASVSNDTLTNLIFMLTLGELCRMARAAETPSKTLPRHALRLALLVGAGIWTKTSTLLLVPTIAAACYLFVKQQIFSAKDAMRLAAVSLGVGLLIGAPWLVRNQILYGDPLAQHIFVSAFGNTAQASDLIRYVFGGSIGAYLGGVARWTFASFWGVFDSMRLFWGQNPAGHPPSPAQGLPPIYNFLAACCLAALVGLLLFWRRPPPPTATQKAMLGAFTVLIGLTGLAHLQFVLVFFQAQGRYWYPALLPLALFFVLGLRGLAVRPLILPVLLLLMAAGLLALNADTLGFLLPARFLH